MYISFEAQPYSYIIIILYNSYIEIYLIVLLLKCYTFKICNTKKYLQNNKYSAIII